MPWTKPRLRKSLRYWNRRERRARANAKHANQMQAKRRKQIKTFGKGPDAAVHWALEQVGTREQPEGSNWGGKIITWIRNTGYTGPVPWCACFATEAAAKGGAPRWRNGYCPSIARAGVLGYERVTDPRPGDFALFSFPGVGGAEADHIGVVVEVTSSTVKCAEGNTSPGTAGSQNNGQGVWLRTRSRSLVSAWVRPPYPKGA